MSAQHDLCAGELRGATRVEDEVVVIALDSELRWFVRSAVRGVPRHHRAAYMYQRWANATDAGNTVEAAIFFGELASFEMPESRLRVPFNFNSVSEEESVTFCFTKSEEVILVELMGLTDITTRERTKASAIKGIVLYRLTVPVRGAELESYFGRSESGISNVLCTL
ncbi:hypothetical protein F442_21795 [Phytophthora nicotianae P10297]|uniref:DDE Tnp4 domain-containing protein n=4 Tax=Phytophthora nicotianae TaxID=4792 RepID=W2Y2P3_PHYNI|nr:hypothetical protein L914_21067 [Phytophthora nicotianae]ETP28992.1 hypothetical protein F442_21795 [Phytophthora nicotianae P10297]